MRLHLKHSTWPARQEYQLALDPSAYTAIERFQVAGMTGRGDPSPKLSTQ